MAVLEWRRRISSTELRGKDSFVAFLSEYGPDDTPDDKLWHCHADCKSWPGDSILHDSRRRYPSGPTCPECRCLATKDGESVTL